jgi:hypothetical protein
VQRAVLAAKPIIPSPEKLLVVIPDDVFELVCGAAGDIPRRGRSCRYGHGRREGSAPGRRLRKARGGESRVRLLLRTVEHFFQKSIQK